MINLEVMKLTDAELSEWKILYVDKYATAKAEEKDVSVVRNYLKGYNQIRNEILSREANSKKGSKVKVLIGGGVRDSRRSKKKKSNKCLNESERGRSDGESRSHSNGASVINAAVQVQNTGFLASQSNRQSFFHFNVPNTND